MATTSYSGIEFCWETCRSFPKYELQCLIAHEMGHVYQSAIDKCRVNMTHADLFGLIPIPPSQSPLKENALVEFHADEMAERWGFDSVAPNVYLFQHYDKKTRSTRSSQNA